MMNEREKQRLCARLELEVGKILDKADRSELTTGGLDSLLKIADIFSKFENEKYWDIKIEYYMAVLDEMQGGSEYSERGYSRNGGGYSNEGGNYSNRGGNRGGRGGYSREGGNSYGNDSSYANRGQHYVRGHYSRSDGRDPYQDYMEDKQSYRSGGKTEDCKKRMLNALDEHMEMLTQELEEMSRDADCPEERETIKRYADKLRRVL